VIRTQQKKKGSAIQVISPQNAYVMTNMLSRVVSDGTLQGPTGGGAIFTYKGPDGKKYTIPSAGKTGTTQNWADAWTVGFTPYMTTAIWFGFDRPGNSLGVNQSGAAVAGSAWSYYMSEIHRGLPYKDFVRPQSGLVNVRVCSVSGLLPTEFCDEGTVDLVFYDDRSVPNRYCDLHQQKTEQAQGALRNLTDQGNAMGSSNVDSTLNVDIPDLDALINSLTAPGSQAPASTPAPATQPVVTPPANTGTGDSSSLLD
jgi:penicillin-binding protein 1A